MYKNENEYFKHSIISTITMLAQKIRGRESVSNLIQYEFDEMMKHSYKELESIRDGHINAYNDTFKNPISNYIEMGRGQMIDEILDEVTN